MRAAESGSTHDQRSYPAVWSVSQLAAAPEDQPHSVFVAAAETDVFCPPDVVKPAFETIPGPKRLTIVPGHYYSACTGFKHETIAVATGCSAGHLRPASPVTGPAGTAGTGR
jgi:hypothetical protein